MRIHIKPFIRWIWGGALIMLIGALIAATDRRYWVRRTHHAEDRPPATGTATGHPEALAT
jgi:cytochrome c-type biogenesis protein CcmF